ncbi:AAA family ATPase [Frondihabitans peucedani]|uniref:AAA family ATPase n=1 Tax=Frondihabitans peucedani TaxID=598626 RepID=A0ABP8DZ09_9MICO
MAPALASVEVRGFKSIESLHLELSTPVTLLIGANGAGKSNVVETFELLGYTVDKGLQAYTLRGGGFSQFAHRSPALSSSTAVSIKAWGGWNSAQNGSVRNGYQMRLQAGPEDTTILEETTLLHGETYERPYERALSYGRESQLRESQGQHKANQYLLNVLSGCRVFHFDDTSFDAPPLRRSQISDYESLHSDASNLPAVLLDIQKNFASTYRRILRSVRNVAPFFDDFVLRPEGESLSLRWREKGLDEVFSGGALSSGTLRFVCLAVLLQQPRQPATIVLDEPELGLHPAAIHQLADLFRNVGPDQRLIAATQSVTLLAQFGIDEVAVIERERGATTVSRPSRQRLAEWLNEYSLGQLWEMNLLGGRPALASQVIKDGQE